MLRDLDIPEDDAGLPTATSSEPNNNPQSENESLASGQSGSNSAGQPLIQKPPTRVQNPADVDKTLMPGKFNHRIHRAYISGRTDQAIRLIDNLLNRSAEPLCEYALIVRALIAREEGQIRESLDWLNRANAHNPNSLRLIYETGRTQMLLGDHERAVACFQKCIDRDPSEWKYYYWKASSLCHRKSRSQLDAINDSQECLLRCPRINRCVNILTFVAKTCIQKNEYLPAIEAYLIAQDLEPENLEVISHLGLLYLKNGNEEKAFSSLGKALTYDPNHLQSIIAAASILQTNGDYDVALSKYKVAINNYEHNGTLWNNIGMCFFGKGKFVASISCLKRANYLCPLDWKILYNLGIVHCSMFQYASAYNFMSSALNLYPKNRVVLVGVAIVLTELNDHVNAQKAYRRALQMDPEDFVARINYAVFEYRHGSLDECKEILKELKLPRNIDHPQISEFKALAENFLAIIRN